MRCKQNEQTNKQINIMEAKVFVTTVKKDNSWKLSGAWLNLNDYECIDDFLADCRKVHPDESDPHFVFLDWDENVDSFISETFIYDGVFDYLKETDEEDAEMVNAFAKEFGPDRWDEAKERFFAKDDIDLENKVYEMLENTGFFDEVDERLVIYFDICAYTRDLKITDFVEVNGYLFWA